MVNIPLGDKAAIRATYSRIDNDGMIDYVNAYQLNEFREPLINVGGNCVDPRAATDTEVLSGLGCFETVEDADFVEIDYAKVSFREWVVPTLGQRSRDPVEAPDGSIWWAGQWGNLVG